MRGCTCKRPCQITRHHRKPISIGGGGSKHNMVDLPRCLHQDWHKVFFNLSAQQIAWKITMGRLLSSPVVLVREDSVIRDRIFRQTAIEKGLLPKYSQVPRISKIAWNAWVNMFGDSTSDLDVIRQINARYLDPYYRLVLAVR